MNKRILRKKRDNDMRAREGNQESCRSTCRRVSWFCWARLKRCLFNWSSGAIDVAPKVF